MFSAAEYFNQIVKPTAGQFYADNKDVRLAMLACMSTLHVIDYVFQNRNDDADAAWQEIVSYGDRASERCFAFKVVRGFALASKHCRLSQPSLRNFHSKKYMIAHPSIAGEAVAGATFVGDIIGGVTIHWSEHGYVNLTQAIEETHEFLQTEFPELESKESGC